jgi:Domain of Unknown Function with PDB structure (DUF3857)
MPSRWSCPAGRSRRRGATTPQTPLLLALTPLLGLVALLAAGAPLAAATVLQKTVEIEIRGDGSLAERTHLEVRLDAATDFAAWSPYPILIDDHRELGAVAAWVRRPDGTTEKVGRQGFDTTDLAGEDVLHTSAKVRLVRFPEAPVGAVLGLDYDLIEHPWFPAGWLVLGAHDAAISHLRVRVRGGGAGWRWSILGPAAGLQVSESPGEVLITAADLPRPADLDHAPEEVREGPVLRYAWRGPATWAEVGRWYDEISRGLARNREEVRQAARRILAGGQGDPGGAGARDGQPPATASGSGGGASRRRQLEEILAFVRREVRYVAVEVGVGGYRPAPAHETLARRWGDCKGKVELLLDLLDEAGIEAYPVLIQAAPRSRIDPEFPSPGLFNHMIAAVPAAGLGAGVDDPVAGGYLFVDPTQTRGGIGWLHPSDQDQWALVLRGERSVLVRTPLRPRLEGSQLTVDLEVRSDGTAAGQLRLELHGGFAAAQADRIDAERPETTAAEAHRLVAALLPEAAATAPRWRIDQDAEVPAATLTAGVALPALVALVALAQDGSGAAAAGTAATAGAAGGTAGGATSVTPVAPTAQTARSLSLGGPGATPAPGSLRDRTAPVVLRPQVAAVRWRIALPDGWCPPQSDSSGLDNAAGAFHQSLTCAGGRLTVDRRTELRQRWVEPAQLPALAELALAEHRAAARRLRLDRLHG